MTLKEAEAKLSELNTKISELLQERETVLKEWNTAFNTENRDQITCVDICVDERIEDCRKLYLVNGESKMYMCYLNSYDMKGSLEDFYKRIDTSMQLQNIAHKGDLEIPEYQKNLVYAKAIELRERFRNEAS